MCDVSIADRNKLSVSPENFHNQMVWLKSKFEIVPVDSLLLNPSHNQIAITFDDGFRDNYEIAANILIDLGIPASFYISTRLVDQQVAMYPITLNKLIDTYQGGKTVPNSLHALTEIFESNGSDFFKLLSEVKEESVSNLWGLSIELNQYCLDNNLLKTLELPMTTEQVKGLNDESLFSVGSHTSTHPAFSNLTIDEISVEILESVEFLTSHGISISRALPIPFGQPVDYETNQIERILTQHNLFSMSTTPATFSVRNHEISAPFPRLSVQDWDINYLKRVIKYMEVLSFAPQLTSLALSGRRMFMKHFS